MKKIILILFLYPLLVFGQGTAEEYINSANEKYELKDYSGAMADVNKAINLSTGSAEAFNLRGLIKHERGINYQLV